MPVATNYNWWDNYPADATEAMMGISGALGIMYGILKTKNTKSNYGVRLSKAEVRALLSAIDNIQDYNHELYNNLRYAVEQSEEIPVNAATPETVQNWDPEENI